MDLKKLGLKIQTLRKAKGFTQRTLSEDSGVAYATLQDLEKGSGNPTVGTLEALAKKLGEPLVDLFDPEKGSRMPAETLEPKGAKPGKHIKAVEPDPKFLEASAVLETWAEASPLSRLCAFWILSKDPIYLEKLKSLPNSAPFLQWLKKAP